MKKSRIVFYGLWSELVDYTKKKLKSLKPVINSAKLDTANIDREAEIIVVFVDSMVTAEIINRFPKLKLVATMSTGYDHIDVRAAHKRGIVVCTVPAYGENTVAEHTFALILGLTRKLFQSVKRVKEGVYDFHGLRGVDLKGKTLGVVGTGHIGTHVIRMAKGFEMQVVAYDAFSNTKLANKLGFTYVSLAKLLSVSDIVTLHAPLMPATRHLINKKNIKKIKSGSFLVNTARGALVEPEALVWALESGRIAGAGLDVLEDEERISHHEQMINASGAEIKTSLMNTMIIEHPNTIVTPHNAFNSTEALQRIVDETAKNIISFIEGEPRNVVAR